MPVLIITACVFAYLIAGIIALKITILLDGGGTYDEWIKGTETTDDYKALAVIIVLAWPLATVLLLIVGVGAGMLSASRWFLNLTAEDVKTKLAVRSARKIEKDLADE